VTVADLGILRWVRVRKTGLPVAGVTPTLSVVLLFWRPSLAVRPHCVMRVSGHEIERVLSPPLDSTDWITEDGARKEASRLWHRAAVKSSGSIRSLFGKR